MATSLARKKLPLVVILGPTASGKTTIAIEVASQIGGEIICADSRTIYKGMDIGTAKPTTVEQSGVPHWGLDLVDPSERFSAAAYQAYAREKIEDIRNRGSIPFLVGGSGLYIDSVLYDYNFPAPITADVQRRLESLSENDRYEYCITNNISLPGYDKNERHRIKSSLEKSQSEQRQSVQLNSIVVGIATNKQLLEKQTRTRIAQMIQDGVVDETSTLAAAYGWSSEAMKSNAYRALRSHIEDDESIQSSIEQLTVLDRQLAKRQMTWFRRNPFIEWTSLRDVKNYVCTRIADL